MSALYLPHQTRYLFDFAILIKVENQYIGRKVLFHVTFLQANNLHNYNK